MILNQYIHYHYNLLEFPQHFQQFLSYYQKLFILPVHPEGVPERNNVLIPF